jgi:hypothetical protein
MKNHRRIWPVAIGLAVALVACSPSPRPDHYPTGTAVKLKLYGTREPIQLHLGPKSAQLFLDMLARQPVHSEISQMPAAPYGKFSVQSAEYFWHGNAVIRGRGRSERLWYGPYLQRLIIDVMRLSYPPRRDSIQGVLDSLERDPTVVNTPLQGPGQYPGGDNDALHPAHLTVGDTNGWRDFPANTNKP